jgi:hypothetical protein
MTFLTARYGLKHALTPQHLQKLSRLSTVYGIRGLRIEEQFLQVEYDASRIHEAEVLAKVHMAGVAVEPPKPIPLGGFGYTREFKDFAWPTQGLTPANQRQK